MGPFSFTETRNPADTSGVVILEMQGGKFQIFGQT
jgi:branched-chain amino acid transport system substrate-binding protein